MLRVDTILCTEQTTTINILRKSYVPRRSFLSLFTFSSLLSCPLQEVFFRSRSKNGSVGLTLMRFLHGMKRFRGGYARLVCHIYNPLWPWTLDRESRSSRATSMPGFHVRGRDFLLYRTRRVIHFVFCPLSLPFSSLPLRLPFPSRL